MRDLFKELYDKVLSLFNASKEELDPTKNIAVNRLKTVLMQDRVGFSERAIQMLKEELITTVSKYMEIDAENFELQIDSMDNAKTVLNLTIPVSRPRTDEEIDNNLKAQQLKTQRKAQEIVEELESLIKERTQALITDGKIDPALIEEATKKAEEITKEETSIKEGEEEKSEEESKEISKEISKEKGETVKEETDEVEEENKTKQNKETEKNKNVNA